MTTDEIELIKQQFWRPAPDKNQMTRDEHRAACIEAMKVAYIRSQGVEPEVTGLMRSQWFTDAMAAAFDALPTAGVRVVHDSVLDEMAQCAGYEGAHEHFLALLASADLTNPPETKP